MPTLMSPSALTKGKLQMSTAVTTEFVSTIVRSEFLGEEPGEGMYMTNTVRRSRFTVKERYGDKEFYTIEVTDAKGTVGAMMHYYFIQYWGYAGDTAKLGSKLVERAQLVADKLEENGYYNQTWSLSQIVDEIEKNQKNAAEALDKFYIYADIARGYIKA
jgi:hypothetical protein